MIATACPARQDLTDYALGKLPDDRSDTISAHLSTCFACQETLRAYDDATDPLIASLRTPLVEEPYMQESGCREVIALVEAIGREPSIAARRDSAGVAASPEDLGDVGQYRLLAKLGEGGMGTVYKALHTRLDKIVALKRLPRDRTQDPRAVARFAREMKAVGRLEHPNIVRAMDANEQDGTHYLVMEYVEGCDLGDLVRRHGPLAIADACELIRQAAVGFQYAHENGLVHRDVKPSNLMLSVGQAFQPVATQVGRQAGKPNVPIVKILDLGLALLRADESLGREMTGEGQMMGTADYIAPEQATDAHSVDIRADIYSLGCTLYKLLTGQAPFADGTHKKPLEVVLAHLQKPIPPVRGLRPEIPEGLASIVERMTAKSPADRFATPAEVAAALEPFTAGCDLVRLVTDAAEPGAKPTRVEPSLTNTDEYVSSAMTGTTPLECGDLSPLSKTPSAMQPSPVPTSAAASRGSGRRRIVIALLAAAAAIPLLFGIWVILRDKTGKEVGRFQVPEGGTVEQVDDQGRPLKPKSVSPAAPKATLKEKPSKQPAGKPKAKPPVVPFDLPYQPIKPGEPLGPTALVRKPGSVPGALGWTIEPKIPTSITWLAPNDDGTKVAIGTPRSVYVVDRVSRRTTLLPTRFLPGRPSWSPDGRVIASCDIPYYGSLAPQGNRVPVWDAVLGRSLGDFSVPAASWPCASRGSISADHRYLAVATNVNVSVYVHFFRVGSQQPLRSIDVGPVAGCPMEWSPRENKLACAPTGPGGTNLLLLDPETPQAIVQRREGLPGFCSSLRWSPDGTRLALGWQIAGETGRIIIHSLPDLEPHSDFTAPKGYGLGQIQWSPDGNRLLTNGWFLVELNENSEPKWTVLPFAWPTGSSVYQVFSFLPKGNLITYARRGTDVVAFTLNPNEPIPQQLDEKSSETVFTCRESSTMLPDAFSLHLVASGETVSVGRMIPVNYQSDSGTAFVPLPDAHSGRYAWSGDRRILAEATEDGQVAMWNAPAGKVVKTLKLDAPVRRLDLSPDGRVLATADDKDVIRLERLDGDQPAPDILSTGGPKSGLVFSPDGKFFAVAATEHLEVWETGSGTKQHQFAVPIAPRTDGVIPSRPVVWSQDGTRLFARGDDNRVRVIDVATGDTVRTIENVPTDGWFVTRDRQPLPLYSWHDGHGGVFVADLDTGDVHSLFAFEDGSWYAISLDGHYRGSPGVEDQLVYVVQKEDAQEMLSPQEFATKYGWKNDPAKVRLTPGIAAEGVELAKTEPEPVQPAEPEKLEPKPQPPHLQPGQPLTPLALVRKPSLLPGVVTWTLDTTIGRSFSVIKGFSPDGRWLLAYGTYGDYIAVWDVATRQPRLHIRTPGIVNWCCWSADGRFIASTHLGEDIVRIWDATTGALLRSFHGPGAPDDRAYEPRGLDWNPCFSHLAANSGHTIVVRHPDSGAILELTESPRVTYQIRWSPDGQYLAVGEQERRQDSWKEMAWQPNRQVAVWNTHGQRLAVVPGTNTWNQGFGWAADGRMFGFDWSRKQLRSARIDRLSAAQVLDVPFSNPWFECAKSAPRLLASDGVDFLSVLDLSSRSPSSFKLSSPARILDGRVALSPDGRLAVASTSNMETDRSLVFWKTNVAQPLAVITSPGRPAPFASTSILASADGVAISGCVAMETTAVNDNRAGWSYDGKRLFWEQGTLRMLDTASSKTDVVDPKRAVAIAEIGPSPDGSRVAVGVGSGPIEIWDVKSPETAVKLSDTGGGAGLAWSPDDRCIATRVGEKVLLINPTDGSQIREINPGLTGNSWTLRFSCDGRWLAVASEQVVQLWDVESGQKAKELAYALDKCRVRLAWLPDNKHVALRCADGAIRTVNIEKGEVVASISDAFDPSDFVWKASWGMFNHDGSEFISADFGSSARVFDTLAGAHLYSVAWLRDNQWLVVTADGHYRGSPGVEKLLGYYLLLDDGSQTMLTPAEFEQRFGWKNDPSQVPQLPGM